MMVVFKEMNNGFQHYNVCAFLENIPILFFSLPLIAAASVIFAATHHESPPVIWRATAEWALWLIGILGAVLLFVFIISRLA